MAGSVLLCSTRVEVYFIKKVDSVMNQPFLVISDEPLCLEIICLLFGEQEHALHYLVGCLLVAVDFENLVDKIERRRRTIGGDELTGNDASDVFHCCACAQVIEAGVASCGFAVEQTQLP